MGQYELTRAELEILKEVCRTLDDLDRLAASVMTDGAMTTGSAGQVVVNPAVSEARGSRALLHRLVSALNLPDDQDETVPSPQRLRAQRAAASRWRGHQTDAQRRAALGTA